MTWPDGSKQPSDAMINESDPLIWGEYSLLYQKRLRDTGPVNILLYLWGEKGDFWIRTGGFSMFHQWRLHVYLLPLCSE